MDPSPTHPITRVVQWPNAVPLHSMPLRGTNLPLICKVIQRTLPADSAGQVHMQTPGLQSSGSSGMNWVRAQFNHIIEKQPPKTMPARTRARKRKQTHNLFVLCSSYRKPQRIYWINLQESLKISSKTGKRTRVGFMSLKCKNIDAYHTEEFHRQWPRHIMLKTMNKHEHFE